MECASETDFLAILQHQNTVPGCCILYDDTVLMLYARSMSYPLSLVNCHDYNGKSMG